MPIYEFVCDGCGKTFEKFLSIHESDFEVLCDNCERKSRKVLSVSSLKVFKSQTVGATLTNKDGEDVSPYVRNKQELTDAINKYNDSERASKTGKVAIFE